MSLSRRSFVKGLGVALLAAPAIVRATSIMPVRNRLITLPESGGDPSWLYYMGWDLVQEPIPIPDEVLYSRIISEEMRAAVAPLARFRQLVEAT